MPVAGGPKITKTGILLEVDAADKTSYPGSGTSWVNQITPGTYDGTLNNISFDSNDSKGALIFTGSNTYVDFGNLGPSLTSSFSFQVAFKPAATASDQPYTILSYASASATSSITFKLDYTSSNQTVVLSTFSTGSGAARTVHTISASVASGSWSIVHGTFGSSLAALYVNGLGQAYAPTTGSVVGYNTVNRLYAGGTYGLDSGFYTGSMANVTVNNADLDGLSVNKNYNALSYRFGLPVRRSTVTDADAFNFVEAAVILDVTQQTAINNLVLGLKANNLWNKMQALYPFVGGTAFSHKFNLKDPRDADDAFRIQFFGSVTHNNLGVSSSAAGYGDTKFVPTSRFVNISSSIHAAIFVSSRPVVNTNLFLTIMGDGDVKDYSVACLNIGRVTNTGDLMGYNAYAFAGNSQVGFSGTTMDGLHISTRTVSTQMEAYRLTATATRSGSGGSTYVKTTPDNRPIRLFNGHTNNSGYTGGILYQYASIGTGLTSTDATNLYSLLTAFNTALGRS